MAVVVVVWVHHHRRSNQSPSRQVDHVGDAHDDVCGVDIPHPKSHVHNDVDACAVPLMHYTLELTHLPVNPDWCRHCNTTTEREFITSCVSGRRHTDALSMVGAASSCSSCRHIMASSISFM